MAGVPVCRTGCNQVSRCAPWPGTTSNALPHGQADRAAMLQRVHCKSYTNDGGATHPCTRSKRALPRQPNGTFWSAPAMAQQQLLQPTQHHHPCALEQQMHHCLQHPAPQQPLKVSHLSTLHNHSSSSTFRKKSRVHAASNQQQGGNSPKPEHPAASGAPPPDAAGNSRSSSNNLGQQQPNGTASSSMSDVDVEAAVDKMLDRTWQELKRDLKKEMSPEQAAMIDSWNLSDIQTDKVFRDIAEQQLGPILELMGVREDPYDFFIDMVKLALCLQLGTAALVFYGAELGLGLDAGDGFRAVAGLGLGYLLRLGIKIEHLAWPLYNALVQLLIREDAVYEYPPATADEKRDTLNKLGLAIACSFLVPKFLFGWQNDDCWQIVVPMIGGLFMFDMCYIVALLIKLWGHEDRQE